MKKIAKIFGAIAAIGAAVVGGVALYKKFISPNEDFEDPDDELDEEFEDEDLDMDTAKTTDRSYVSLTPAEEPKEEAPTEETSEEATEKEAPAEEAAEEATEEEAPAEEAAPAEEPKEETPAKEIPIE